MKHQHRAFAAFGASGTGKTAWVRQLIERMAPRRLIVWDFKHDAGLEGLGERIDGLPSLIRAMADQTYALRYMVDHDGDIAAQFDLFCRAAWAAGNLTMFVDELPEVTKANKAPASWRKCVNVGRSYTEGGKVKRLVVIGAGQRPAECDKSFIGNCEVVHTGRLAYLSDAKWFSSSWGVNPLELTKLPDLHWVESRAGSGELTRGVLSFGNTSKKSQGRKTPP